MACGIPLKKIKSNQWMTNHNLLETINWSATADCDLFISVFGLADEVNHKPVLIVYKLRFSRVKISD